MQDTELLRAFIAEHCVQDPSATISASDFVGSFRAWSARIGHSAPRTTILQGVQALGFTVGIRGDRSHVAGLKFRRPGFELRDGRLIRAQST